MQPSLLWWAVKVQGVKSLLYPFFQILVEKEDIGPSVGGGVPCLGSLVLTGNREATRLEALRDLT